MSSEVPVQTIESGPKDSAPSASSEVDPLEKRTRYSGFLVTVNPNKPLGKYSAEAEKLRGLLKNFNKQVTENIQKYITITRKGHSFKKPYFRDINNCTTTEWGDHNKNWHSHIGIWIAHRSNIRLDRAKLKAEAQTQVIDKLFPDKPGSKFHFDITVFNSKERLFDYVLKSKQESKNEKEVIE